MQRTMQIGALLLIAVGLGGCAASRDARQNVYGGGYTRQANEARLDAQDQQKRTEKIRDAKVMAEEDKVAVDEMLQAAQTASGQLDADLARANRQNKGSAKERAALAKELADIKQQTAAVQKQRAAPQVSPEELARSRQKLQELTERRQKLTDQVNKALKS